MRCDSIVRSGEIGLSIPDDPACPALVGSTLYLRPGFHKEGFGVATAKYNKKFIKKP